MLTKVPNAGDGIFAGIQPHKFTFERHGRYWPFELPQRFYDWSLMLAHFPASAAAVREFLPRDSGLEPVTIAPGIAVVSLGAFEYRRAETLIPYNEVGVMFPVLYRRALRLPAVPLFRPEWFSDLGFYIWQLPVTSLQSCDAGRALWNFPKTVGDITFVDSKDRRRCTWRKAGKLVLTLEVRTSSTTRQLRNFLGYSVMSGRVQQTLVQTLGEYDESRFGLDATFSLGDHPIARRMRRLGMVDTAVGRLYCPRAEGILPGPSPMPFKSVPSALKAPQILQSIVARSAPKRKVQRRTVAILGGGVAGLSAAHELAERGFDVTVYEQRGVPGGKARSEGVPDTAGVNHEDLPCEHGFRFFPGFYKHLPDTMARIPDGPNHTVADNLVSATRLIIDFLDSEDSVGGKGSGAGKSLVFPARFPASLGDIGTLLLNVGLLQERTGCTAEEVAFYIGQIWQLLTSCVERRLDQYEQISWWDYIGADQRSKAYQLHLASTTRSLVAADPRKASTRTVGNILLQMLFDFATPGVSVDRVLNGPTNEVWFDPWVRHLKSLGVDYRRNAIVHDLQLTKDGRIARAMVNGQAVHADYYIAAVPVERMAELIRANGDLVAADPRLGDVVDLSSDVESMTGIQFYFRETLPLEGGHYMHLDSEWALTSLAQAQFWKKDLSHYGDGSIRDVLSVDISDWNTKGGNKKRAKDCTRGEIKEEVWNQLQRSLPFLRGLEPAAVFLDADIVDHHGRVENVEPLLVNHAKRWHLRPEATTAIPNLFLAADYVRTNTDLATMEGANEAARRAVNAILEASHSPAEPCVIWELHQPVILGPWHWIDRHRYRRGIPWNSDFPLALRGLEVLLTLADSVTRTFGRIIAPDALETAETTVSEKDQKDIEESLTALMAALKRGRPAAIRRFFSRHAVVTFGLEQGPVDEMLRHVTRPLDVHIHDIATVYQRAERVHLRMTVWVSEPGAAPGQHLEAYVHVVFVLAEHDRATLPAKTAGGGPKWLIGSLRYRRAGAPARLESLPIRRRS